MANWINHPLTLQGHLVELRSFDESHLEALTSLASDKRIWEFYAYDPSSPERYRSVFNSALSDREKGIQFPFSIFDRDTQKIIGSTRFMDIQPNHKKLEIGTTWLHPEFWGTPVNTECKLLLLTYCFENLATLRVQLKTDENNIRSRKAIEKIGARFEGILRNDMLRENGTHRHSAYYSIINDEWLNVKAMLSASLANRIVK
ncbi:GNAT family N-acetyltransferase [Pseudochryseolinea flava]|uniref:N-acetyltransferase n=1 Tax=Pseudochryseolinea flava TaxID=2059302 RepID=A0A364XXJ7_9BACT|nr:GNAT family protein [Pseudochryseolinea flava]RAV98944.1 N-acetyltransferase [Pseudochryseolinea flava]